MKLKENGEFVIEDYQKQRPFSSFLPGIAGLHGIPIWVYYTNRGQGIASFGIENKDNAILEFFPANRAYQFVSLKGFRTFIKYEENNLYEPFTGTDKRVKSKMIISPYMLTLEEVDEEKHLIINVKYFILPNEDFAAFIRKVTIENTHNRSRKVEILDGLPEIIPYGLSNMDLKEVSQTIAAWCRVYNLENKAPFYRIKATTADTPEVHQLEKGHFYLAFSDKSNLLTPLVDPQVIFGQNTDFQKPVNLTKMTTINLQQMVENRFPSAMSLCEAELKPGSSITINSIFGHISNKDKLEEIKDKVLSDNYLDKKEVECKEIHNRIMDNIFTKSNIPVFDYYCRQTYLDNIMRGGLPVNLVDSTEKENIYYTYSRKHGDLERDYNYFHLEASPYSQGNGNYRDVNQNRRCDNFFNSEIGDFNIKLFANLIQVDGYNPLVIKGNKFYLEEDKLNEVLKLIEPEKRKLLAKRLKQSFTPGEISLFLLDHNIELDVDIEAFIEKVIEISDSVIDADFGEGYWVDHWTYLLDLIENYLAIYPEKAKDLFINDNSYYFYDSYVKVKPRSRKYLLTEVGPRQLDAIEKIEEKRKLIEEREEKPYQLRIENGKGKIYRTNLLVKLLSLITNKISSLDLYGIGIEMEANKPGWYDALNGLPGIFGSSTSETLELKRLVDYLLKAIDSIPVKSKLKVPLELLQFTKDINKLIILWLEQRDNYYYWNNASSLREEYREKVFYGFNGEEKELKVSVLQNYLRNISEKLEYAIDRASETTYNLYSTYYYYKPVEYNKTGEFSEEGHPYIQVSKFEQTVLPPFLEGQVRAMKILEKETVKELHEKVKESELYDRKLKMYKLNGDLSEMPDDIGRARAFTPGWLENGSIWLHMEYKYLLELIKKGLYEEFYQAAEDCLIPFQDPERYGRSILENSSFIMSSSNPDKENHGRGYIARLSGSTAEFLNIWLIMSFGLQPFKMQDEELVFQPRPVLRKDFFTKASEKVKFYLDDCLEELIIPENTYACSLFGKVLVVYHNHARKNTYPEVKIKEFRVTMKSGEIKVINSDRLNTHYVKKMRDSSIKRVDIYLI